MTTLTPTPEHDTRGGRGSFATWIGAGALLAFAAGNVFLLWRTSAMDDEIRKLRSSMQTQAVEARESTSASANALRRTIDQLNAEIQETRTQAGSSAKQARTAATATQRHAEKLVSSLEEKQRGQQQEFTAMLGEVKQSTEATNAQVSGVITDVGAVRSEVAQTKGELDKAVSDLKSVRGDLGVQSGLIATNSRELAALRDMGERYYYEFDIPKTGRPHKVANILVTVKKADPKRNRFTVELTADDRMVEKKDKTLNEPVQFYVAGGRQPYEMVVNEVRKDRIVGYLSAPKLVQARR